MGVDAMYFEQIERERRCAELFKKLPEYRATLVRELGYAQGRTKSSAPPHLGDALGYERGLELALKWFDEAFPPAGGSRG